MTSPQPLPPHPPTQSQSPPPPPPQQSPSAPEPTPTPPPTLRIGTRASALALAQTDLFISLLRRLSPTLQTSTHPMTTAGDHNQTAPLHALATTTPGGKSLWTHELEARLLAGELDCIVHSLKDVPTTLVKGCVVRTVGAREESRDCVVMRAGRDDGGVRGLGELEARGGGVVGTSSVRRAAMIKRRWPGLVIQDVRGNVGTRLRKLDDESLGFDALVLAGAGVQRLGLGHRVSGWLEGRDGVLAAVGQGALGVEFREGDEWVGGLVRGVEDKRVGWACVAERALLGELEGGCSVPVGVETEWEEDERHITTTTTGGDETTSSLGGGGCGAATLTLTALIVSPDGKDAISASRREWISGDREADSCGRELARELVGRGAGRILEGIYREREEMKGKEEGKSGEVVI